MFETLCKYVGAFIGICAVCYLAVAFLDHYWASNPWYGELNEEEDHWASKPWYWELEEEEELSLQKLREKWEKEQEENNNRAILAAQRKQKEVHLFTEGVGIKSIPPNNQNSSKFSVTAGNQLTFHNPTTRARHSENAWSEMPSMNHARCGFAAVVIGERLFVFGGKGADHIFLSSVEMYDPKYGRWSIMGPMRFIRYRCAAAPVGDNQVLICGGLGCATDGLIGNCREIIAHAELYDIGTGLSVALPPMNIARFGCTAVAVDNKVFVFGGLGDRNALVANGEVFIVQTQTWLHLPPMNIINYRRLNSELAATVVGESIVIIGDCFAGTFGTRTGKWDTLPANARISTNENGAVAVGDKIFILEKIKDDRERNRTCIFDLANRSLTPFQEIQVRRESASIVAIGHKLFVLGGFDSQNHMIEGCLSSGEEIAIPNEWRANAGSANLNTQNQRACIHCNHPNASNYCKACGADSKYYYCNKECQMNDWKKHKHICKKKKYKKNKNQ